MATRANTTATLPNGSIVVTWPGLTNATTDNGDGYELPAGYDVTVQGSGTFGAGGAMAMLGTNLAVIAPTTDGNVGDLASVAISLTAAAAVKAVGSRPRIAYPRVTAGDGTTNLVCTMLLVPRRAWR